MDPGQQLRVVWWRLVLGGLLLVGLGVLVGRFWGVPEKVPAPAAVEPASAERAADAKRLAALEREVRALRATLTPRPLTAEEPAPSSAGTAPSVVAHEPAANESAMPERAEAAARRGEQQRAEFLDALAKRVDSEPYDPRWRAETEGTLSRVLPAQFGPDVAVEELACASSVCRVRLRHAGSTRLPNDKVSKFLDHRESLANLELQVDAREGGVTTLYFVREEAP